MMVFKIIFIGVGFMIFVKNIFGDVFYCEVLKLVYVVLMDIDEIWLEELYIVVWKLMDLVGVFGWIICYINQKVVLQDVDFVVVVFQIGGYEFCIVIDFEVCKCYGLEQMIVDMLGLGGIMCVLWIILYLWWICEDMMEVCLKVIMFNYVNLMVMNIWVMYVCYLYIKQVGLCYLVQGMVEELVCDLNIDFILLCYCCVGINYMVFYFELECKMVDGIYVNFYFELLVVYDVGQVLKFNIYGNECCQNIVCYEMFKKLGYFVIELLEYFVEYMLWFIKLGCEDLIVCYKVLLDEYLKCCVE